MALSARTQTLGVSLAVHVGLAALLALGGRQIFKPEQTEKVVEIDFLPDEIEEAPPEEPSVLEPPPEVPVIKRPERVPDKLVARVIDKPRPFQPDALIEEGEHEAPEDAEALAMPTSPLTFAMTETVGGSSGLDYSSTTGGNMALPPPGPGGGAPGQSYAPGATNLKVAKDWQVSRLANPINDRSFAPAYPPLAKRQGLEAAIVVELDINDEGLVVNARVLEGTTAHGFRESALSYARKLRFEPAMAGENPVASRIEWTVHFYVRN